MITLGVEFTNFGPYHLARLRTLASTALRSGIRLIAFEVAGAERRYPWRVSRQAEPFTWLTLFPNRALETVPRSVCARAMALALIKHRPHALLIAGYSRPESLVALAWARYMGRPAVLMSDTQSGDRPRIRWKETLKKMLVRSFDTALVAGPRQCDYLVGLGLPPDRIVQGYYAVDNTFYAERSTAFRRDPAGRSGLPVRNYFLAVSRFAPEKNLPCLIRAYAAYRRRVPDEHAWDLVLCGDGPEAARIDAVIQENGLSHAIHRPGFLQADELVRWYAFASGFVLPSLIEPWGLVVNEAAACGLPLLISDRAGSAEVLVPRAANTTGRRFDPTDESDLALALAWLSRLPRSEWEGLGRRAAELVSQWGPERFAQGALEALDLAFTIISKYILEIDHRRRYDAHAR